MGESKHTPGPWALDGHNLSSVIRCVVPKGHPNAKHVCGDYEPIASAHGENWRANARLIAAAPEMLEALRLHKAWADSEERGPDYGGQNRDSHPDGERIWRQWWNGNLDLCDRAQAATDAAIAKAEGRS